jgi:hypothetical protein
MRLFDASVVEQEAMAVSTDTILILLEREIFA